MELHVTQPAVGTYFPSDIKYPGYISPPFYLPQMDKELAYRKEALGLKTSKDKFTTMGFRPHTSWKERNKYNWQDDGFKLRESQKSDKQWDKLLILPHEQRIIDIQKYKIHVTLHYY